MKSCIASYRESASGFKGALKSGRSSGGTLSSCSPYRCNTTLLVTSTLSPGAAASNSLTTGAPAATCSKLSRTMGEALGVGWMFNACMILIGTSDGLLTPASATNHTPSANVSRKTRATCCARRVLPLPPEPTSVIRWTSSLSNSFRSCSTAHCRPMSRVTSAGKLCRWGCL